MTQQGFPSLELADWIMRLIIISVAAKSFHTSAGVCSRLEKKDLWEAVTLRRRVTLAAL